jgi:hypothetical protein
MAGWGTADHRVDQQLDLAIGGARFCLAIHQAVSHASRQVRQFWPTNRIIFFDYASTPNLVPRAGCFLVFGIRSIAVGKDLASSWGGQ